MHLQANRLVYLLETRILRKLVYVCAHLLATLAVFPVLIAQQSLTAPLSCKTLILLERLPHCTSSNLGIFIEAIFLLYISTVFFSFFFFSCKKSSRMIRTRRTDAKLQTW